MKGNRGISFLLRLLANELVHYEYCSPEDNELACLIRNKRLRYGVCSCFCLALYLILNSEMLTFWLSNSTVASYDSSTR